jgi:flagellar basal-body rod modification protein FlgD
MAIVNGVSYGNSLLDVTAPVEQRTASPNMNQQDFLKIMIAQLKSQNPLDSSGSDSQAFFQQMVQFQSLDAMTAMHQAIEQLSQVSSLSSATSLIGKTVTASVSPGTDPITGLALPAESVSGTVLNVTFDPSNGAVLHLDTNVAAPASAVSKVQ